MRMRPVILAFVTLGVLSVCVASAQTSSLGGRKRQADAQKPPGGKPRVQKEKQGNSVIEEYSWIAVKPDEPKTFKPNDLITIVVREQRKFQADAELETEKTYDIKSELSAFFKPTAGGLGSAAFRRGKPNTDYKFTHGFEGEADTKRKDKLTTRITAKIIDVTRNGLLVLEATSRIEHDEEISEVTLTGTCRKEDVTADNTVLSTQIADKNIVIKTEGALRDSARRGWIPKLIDALRPF